MNKISVIMPVYNTPEEWLRESIESILNQTYKDFEFLIIDDGSTNNVPNILAEYAEKDSRIKIILGEHKGISNALNKGLDLSNGDFIARMDGDDISLPNRFERQIEFLNNNSEISICGTGIKFFPNEKNSYYPDKIGIVELLNFCCIAHPTVMMRKKDLLKYNLKYDESFKSSEDYELWSRAIKYVNIANISDVLLHYRRNPNGNSKNKKTVEYDSIIKKRLMDYISRNKNVQNLLWKYLKKEEQKKIKFLQKFLYIGNIWRNGQKVKFIKILGLNFYKKYGEI